MFFNTNKSSLTFVLKRVNGLFLSIVQLYELLAVIVMVLTFFGKSGFQITLCKRDCRKKYPLVAS